MCLAKAYMQTQGDAPIMEDIGHLEMNGDQIRLTTMFGEEKTVAGQLLEIDFENSKVLIAPSKSGS